MYDLFTVVMMFGYGAACLWIGKKWGQALEQRQQEMKELRDAQIRALNKPELDFLDGLQSILNRPPRP